MVAPALPPGWCFAGATLLAAEVRARYAHEGSPRAHAELRLTHPDASVEGARTERFRARLLSTQGAPALALLRDALLAAVRTAEPAFAWADTAPRSPSEHPAPAPTRGAAPGPTPPRAPESEALQHARNLFAQGLYDEASDALTAAARDAAAPALRRDARALHGELLWQSGRHHEALTALDAALARDPDSAALHCLAMVFRGEHHDPRAADHARALVALSDGDPGPTLRAARALLALGLDDEARRVAAPLRDDDAAPVTQLLDLAALYEGAGDYASADALYARALALEPANPGALLGAGTLGAWRGESHTARARAEAVLAAQPDAAAALCLRGAAHMLDGDAARALDDFNRAEAVTSAPDPVTSVWRAEALLRGGRYAEAVAEARRGGVRSDDISSHVAAQLVIALAQIREGTFPGMPEYVLKQALATLRADAAPLRPRDAAVPYEDLVAQLEKSLAKLRGNRSPAATYVRHDGSLTRLDAPFSPRVASKRALWRFVSTGDPREALAAFDAVHARAPDAAEPYNYRGELYLYLGDAAAARREFERAIARYERSRWAYIGLAGAAVLEARYEEALGHIASSVSLAGPPGPTAFVYRGEAHRRLGHRAEARADLETCVRAHPQRIGAWVNLALLSVAEGDLHGAHATLDTLRHRAPGFVADAARGLQTSPAALTDAPALAALFEEMLAMLRGNRGSSCVTYFTRDGTLRAVSPHTNRDA